MNRYRMIRPLLFRLEPERAHGWALAALRRGWVPSVVLPEDPRLAQRVWGRPFAHPLGLAAGFDKNAEAMRAVLNQGMAFTEAGTVTPLPQAGNPQPRMFRLMEDEAVINRLGFNNKGAGVYQTNLERFRAEYGGGLVGVNIGKNKDTVRAEEDYLILMRQLYRLADYLVVNISSPNTPGLRDLQKRDLLEGLVRALMTERERLALDHGKTVPLVVKIAPDMTDDALQDICAVARACKVDGLTVSNTTVARPDSLKSLHAQEQGGLSGRPLMEKSTAALAKAYRMTEGTIPLIGVGGIASAEDAYRKIRSGATLLQLYTALVYRGFGLVREIHAGLSALLERDGFSNVAEAVGADVRRES